MVSFRRSSIETSGRQDIITKAYKSPVIATTLGLGMVGTFVGGSGYLGDALPWGSVLQYTHLSASSQTRTSVFPISCQGTSGLAAPPILGRFRRNRLGNPPSYTGGEVPHLVRLTRVWGPGVTNSSLRGCVIQLVTQGSRNSPLPILWDLHLGEGCKVHAMTSGQGQGVTTWRNILLSASFSGALAKLAVLEGGAEGSGEGDVVTRTTSCHCCVESHTLLSSS